jgi:hypothetical protein
MAIPWLTPGRAGKMTSGCWRTSCRFSELDDTENPSWLEDARVAWNGSMDPVIRKFPSFAQADAADK